MLLSTSAAYLLWAPHYDESPNPLLAVEERMLYDILPDVESQVILDVGCGTGRSAARYSTRGALVFGADPCAEMLAEARRKPGLETRLVLAVASYLPFADEIADVTMCSFAMSYIQDVARSVGEFARVTKRDGRIVISDLHPIAIRSGWTRSFRIKSETYEIAHSPHPGDELTSAFQRAGLQIVTEAESGFSAAERPIFAAAGKAHVFPSLIGTPAVRVLVCKKI